VGRVEEWEEGGGKGRGGKKRMVGVQFEKIKIFQ